MRNVTRQPTTPVSTADVIHDERRYVFLTPVFGGGVRIEGVVKPHDPVTFVRAPSLRGQLRFWWRAVNPRGCNTVEELRSAEAQVFGAASVSSREALDVTVTEQPSAPTALQVMRPNDKFKTEEGMESIGYGAFPLRDPDGVKHGTLHVYTRPWAVRFRYGASARDDLEAALWAFAHFGGLGGRTRRGFGAVSQESPKLPSLDDGWARWITKPSRREDLPWPTLRADRTQWVVTAPRGFREGIEAQKHLLDALKQLRQAPKGRNPTSAHDTKRPGRSYWPEADAIRAMTGRSAPAHRARVTHVDAFPRSAFGMPIVFHFKDSGEPTECSLVPMVAGEAHGRLASPLILRPHKTPQGEIEALAVVLSHPAYEHVTIQDRNNAPRLHAHVTAAEAAGLKPLNAPTQRFTNPLLRYLHLLRTGQ